MRNLLAIALAVCLSISTTAAFADTVDDEIVRLEAEAATAYSTGEYQKAINLMVRANQLRPHPNYLLNIAVSYSKLGDCQNAVLWANLALEADNPLPPEARPAAESVLEECAPAPEIKGPNNGGIADPENGNGEGDNKATGLSTGQIWGFALVGVGVLGAGSNLLFLDYPLSEDQSEFTKKAATPGGFPSSKAYDDRKSELESQQLLVIAVYSLSAAAIVTGGVLLTLDALEEEPKPAKGVMLTPIITPEGAGVQLGVRW